MITICMVNIMICLDLKRSFQLTGNENMVPVSESPTYPGSNLSDFFKIKFDKEVHGT